MDIFFADIRGLTPDLQTPAKTDPSLPLSPPERLAGNIATEPADQLQTIEFNEFFDHLSDRKPVPDESMLTPPDGAWREFLAQAPVRVTTDGEPALMPPGAAAPATIAATLRVASTPALPGQPPAAGETLPANGISLPGPIPAGPPAVIFAPSAFGTTGATVPLTAEAPRDAGRAALDAVAARASTPAEPQPAPLDKQARETATTVAPRREAPSTPLDADRFATRPDIPATERRPVPQPVIAIGKSAATILPVSANPEPMSSSGAVPRQSAASAALAAMPGPVQVRTDSFAAAPEPVVAPPRGGTATNEAALANLPRPTPAGAPLAAFGSTEAPGVDGLPVRAPEVAAPAPATSAAPPQLISIPSAPGVATPGVATPGFATPGALPPHLESLALPRQADAADWGNGLGERVSWMIDQRHNSATIRLDPPLLGKLDVQVRVADDATTITIQAQHAPTRELIEASATRLREFLQESGFQNVNVDVSQRQDQQQARAQTAPDAGEQADAAPSESDHPGTVRGDREPVGEGAPLIDTFV